MRALLVANANDADGGFVAERFRFHGYAFTECHRERPADWPDLDGVDLVMLLGSEWSVYWPEVAESVAAESALVRDAHERGVPIFGICYGNQLMASALGGTVERARESEIGWYSVVTDEPTVIAEGPWLQWHSDVVTVPAGAVEMARSPVGPQAWQLGRSFCTQFHPEATETVVRRWLSMGGDAQYREFGGDPEALLAETRANVDESRRNSDHLVDWFVARVRS